MVMTDPIADLLTRLRNASSARQSTTTMPASKMKKAVLELLVREGFIESVEEAGEGPKAELKVTLKFSHDGEGIICGLTRISKPSRRVYIGADHIKPVLHGRGTAILSTNKGLLTDKESRRQKVGGEVLCHVW